ncbi:MAG TPA: signal peptidase I [Actinomycetales bacterium]|nr:signal peptidase I [Actinomycetales bacterium]
MRWVRRVVVWSVIVSLALAVAGGALAWHQGYRAYAIKTGSMTPTYPTGSLVVDRPADGTPPVVGDIITFGTEDGLVTHRVHAIQDGGIETKGDANRASDAGLVPFSDVAGEVVWGAAHLGYVFVFFQQPTGALSLMLLALSVYLAWTVFFPAKPEDAAEHAADDAGTTPSASTPSATGVDVTKAPQPADGVADLVVLFGQRGASDRPAPTEIDLSDGGELEHVGPTRGQQVRSHRLSA